MDEIWDQGKRDLGWALTFYVILFLAAYFVTQLTFRPEIILSLTKVGN